MKSRCSENYWKLFVLKEINSLGTKHMLSKKEIDRVVQDKKNLIKKTRANLMAMSKHEIINYGP